MLLYNRRFFLLSTAGATAVAAAALAGCGFTPAFGPGSVAQGLQNTVMLRAPTNKNEYDFVKAVEDRLGYATTHTYNLTYSISIASETVAVTTAQEQQRVNLNGTLDFTLTHVDGTAIARGRETGFTSYSTSGSTIATDSAQKDANRRLMQILVDHMVVSFAAKLAP